jgi:3-oxoadipate enol-lactonase
MYNTVMPDYSIHGESDSTIFLLHGLYGAKEYWRSVTIHLVQAGYRVVAWDAPGYGLGVSQTNFQLTGAAETFVRLIAKLGTDRNVILGQSMGGQIATRVYKLVPGLLSGVVVASTLGFLGNKTPAEREDFVKSRQTVDLEQEAQFDRNLAMVESMLAPGASGRDVEMVKLIGATTPGHAITAGVRAMQAAKDEEAIEALRSISAPSLFIAGQEDKIGSPAGMRRLADLAPKGRLAIIPGCGHYTWAEAPALFWSEVMPFLTRVCPIKT